MRLLTKIYIWVTVLLIFDLTLYLWKGISLSTNIADQILFWCWFILTFIIVFNEIRTKWAKVYGFILIGLVILSSLPMGIPILTVFAFSIPNFSDAYTYYSDSEIQLELTSKSVIGKTYIGVKRNYLILEREIAQMDAHFEYQNEYFYADQIRSVKRLDAEDSDRIRLNFNFGVVNITREIKAHKTISSP